MNLRPQRYFTALTALLALGPLLLPARLHGQGSADYAVQLTAAVQEEPVGLVLLWPESPAHASNDCAIYRRMPGAASWGDPIATGAAVRVLEDGRRSFIDTAVEAGRAYE